MRRSERRRRRWMREFEMGIEFLLAIMVACGGEQHGIPGLVIIGFALMGIIGCRAWRYR